MDRDRWRISGKTAYEFIQDEAVALNLRTGLYYRLNAVAASALDGLAGGAGVDDLIARLVQDFDVEPAILRRDLGEFLSELEKYGLIEPVP